MMILPSAPHLSKPHENFRIKKFGNSDIKVTPSSQDHLSSIVQTTPPNKPKQFDRSSSMYHRRTRGASCSQTFRTVPQKKPSKKSFESFLSSIDFGLISNQKSSEKPTPQTTEKSPYFIRKNYTSNGIRSEDKTRMNSMLDSSAEDVKPNYRLNFSHSKEGKRLDTKPETCRPKEQVPFIRRSRGRSFDSVIKPSKRYQNKMDSERISKMWQIENINRIIAEDPDEGSSQRGGRDGEYRIQKIQKGDEVDSDEEWRFIPSRSGLYSNKSDESPSLKEYEREVSQIDQEIVEFIRMSIARKGILLGRLKAHKGTERSSFSEELMKMKKFIENALILCNETNGLNLNDRL